MPSSCALSSPARVNIFPPLYTGHSQRINLPPDALETHPQAPSVLVLCCLGLQLCMPFASFLCVFSAGLSRPYPLPTLGRAVLSQETN